MRWRFNPRTDRNGVVVLCILVSWGGTVAFSTAEVRNETRRLDFGTAAARPFLIGGFSVDETRQGQTFVWSEGEVSAVGLRFANRTPRVAVIRCWSLAYRGAPEQSMEISLNGSPVSERRVGPRPQRIRFELPVDLQRIGENRLEIRYAHVRRPAEVFKNSVDRRELAVAWDWLRVARKTTDETTRVSEGEPSVGVFEGRSHLALPAGSLVTYYARIKAGSTLEIDALWERDAEGKRFPTDSGLLLYVETDMDGTSLETVIERRAISKPIPIPAKGERIVEISIGPAPGFSGVALEIVGARLVISDSTPEGNSDQQGGPRPARGGAETPQARLDDLRSPGSNVLLYVIDTLRADYLGAYGGTAAASPNLDRLAREGVLFEVSIFTGLRPSRHGVVGRDDGLALEADTLAERLSEAGYRTAGFITNANVSAGFHVNQGFEKYEWYPHGKDRPNEGTRSSVRASESALEWIAAGDDSRPFFAFVHVSDPHGPYQPPKLEREKFAGDIDDSQVGTGAFLRSLAEFRIQASEPLRRDLAALYRAEVAYTDARLGDLLERLEALGHCDDTWIVMVADHGEEFFDHGWWEHGKTLYAEQIHVPLLMRLPAGRLAGQRFRPAVRQIDLMPTLLDGLGLPQDPSIDGRSLLPLLASGRASAQVPSFASLDIDGRRVESVIDRELKLIETFEYSHPKNHHPGVQLFDLSVDPGERLNLASRRPIAVRYLLSKLRAERSRAKQGLEPSPAILDAATEEELRTLGYLP
jgi:arylsulfatase A-like enzyme